jgi:2-C-methyl-D-erythritol 4-phosphate cytidylyltransferase / 2-C-methyl-D-erythritol 2,4-cyclodiphosphate synthase
MMHDQNLTACAIIVAGGRGTRASAGDPDGLPNKDLPKQLQPIAGKPVILWSIEAFAYDARCKDMIIVCPDDMRQTIFDMGLPSYARFASAGSNRTESVRAGLEAAQSSSCDIVFIHDAARPGLDQACLDRLFDALQRGVQGCAPARSVTDALWHSEGAHFTKTQSRDGLLRVQTPQAFVRDTIMRAYAAIETGSVWADDLAVARAFGATLMPVQGSERLDKITWPEDFARMAQILSPALLPRLGTGYDAHRFARGEFVTLCGVNIPHDKALAGHSDADVGWHALADAIYGALSAGDIGHHFPPSDPQWKGAASSVFLKHAGDLVQASGGVINHVDLTLICEAPKVGPHRTAMIEATASVLGLRPDQVSIKATTTEGMGFTGRREGIAAQASATILLSNDYRPTKKVLP